MWGRAPAGSEARLPLVFVCGMITPTARCGGSERRAQWTLSVCSSSLPVSSLCLLFLIYFSSEGLAAACPADLTLKLSSALCTRLLPDPFFFPSLVYGTRGKDG